MNRIAVSILLVTLALCAVSAGAGIIYARSIAWSAWHFGLSFGEAWLIWLGGTISLLLALVGVLVWLLSQATEEAQG